MLYRGMDRAALDAAYDNTAAVANSAAMLADFDARSAQIRAARPQHLNLRYGPAERNRIDYFAAPPTTRPAPILVFIHGGYWQMRAKETFSFVAAGPLAHGIHVALPGYTLAPAITLEGIVAEVRAAVCWVAQHAADFGGDPHRIIVSGWSAGGHLAAVLMGESAVKGGLAISGIFDLEPIRLNYLNSKLGLDAHAVQQFSPLTNLPGQSLPLMLACGTGELPELQRQSEIYAEARAKAHLPGRLVRLPQHNHFTILEELARSDGALTALVRELVAV
ncbi:MAG: alpha/beta hydrolase [Burkholderiales bacterium]